MKKLLLLILIFVFMPVSSWACLCKDAIVLYQPVKDKTSEECRETWCPYHGYENGCSYGRCTGKAMQGHTARCLYCRTGGGMENSNSFAPAGRLKDGRPYYIPNKITPDRSLLERAVRLEKRFREAIVKSLKKGGLWKGVVGKGKAK